MALDGIHKTNDALMAPKNPNNKKGILDLVPPFSDETQTTETIAQVNNWLEVK